MTSNRAATFDKRSFRLLLLNRVQHLKKKLLNIGSLFVYNILLKFSRSSEIDGKNRKRDSRTRFQAKPKTFRKQLRIICTFVPFTILNIIHKY